MNELAKIYILIIIAQADASHENNLSYWDFVRFHRLRIFESWYQHITYIFKPGYRSQREQLHLVSRFSRTAEYTRIICSEVLIINWLWLPSGFTRELSVQLVTVGGAFHLNKLRKDESLWYFAIAISIIHSVNEQIISDHLKELG